MLAAHVVGGGEHLPERRPAQHPVAVGVVPHAEGEVGVAAGDEVEGERGLHGGHVLLEPPGHPGDVDALDRPLHPTSSGGPRTVHGGGEATVAPRAGPATTAARLAA